MLLAISLRFIAYRFLNTSGESIEKWDATPVSVNGSELGIFLTYAAQDVVFQILQ